MDTSVSTNQEADWMNGPIRSQPTANQTAVWYISCETKLGFTLPRGENISEEKFQIINCFSPEDKDGRRGGGGDGERPCAGAVHQGG